LTHPQVISLAAGDHFAAALSQVKPDQRRFPAQVALDEEIGVVAFNIGKFIPAVISRVRLHRRRGDLARISDTFFNKPRTPILTVLDAIPKFQFDQIE
jgi:hypothetical protein